MTSSLSYGGFTPLSILGPILSNTGMNFLGNKSSYPSCLRKIPRSRIVGSKSMDIVKTFDEY